MRHEELHAEVDERLLKAHGRTLEVVALQREREFAGLIEDAMSLIRESQQ